ncbi:fimbria/pilus periplasmic chaperone [Providencia alcalifaciens]|uniref:fimbrial biogenesis chaperone n=1 Tax=Providencia TaxID=586 RepID=UPI0012B594F6|nr:MULTISPECIES: molecular chaperone [Providencia]MTC48282.1 fimbria/pilus periplasmic chaperone [Providencia alcalifaciens]
MKQCSQYFQRLLPYLIYVFISVCAQAADGGISLDQTRVIFGAEQRNKKVTLINQSDQVYLMNSRVLRSPDDGTAVPETLPFIVAPPLFRLESDSRHTVTVVRNDTSELPADRESVFYLSFLAIPSISKPTDNFADGGMQPQVSVGMRSVIKLFYRPEGLTLPVRDAAEKLVFTPQGQFLHVVNPTPYYLTLAQLQVNGRVVNTQEQGAMIAPFSDRNYHITGAAREVNWSVINDYGGHSRTYQIILQEK